MTLVKVDASGHPYMVIKEVNCKKGSDREVYAELVFSKHHMIPVPIHIYGLVMNQPKVGDRFYFFTFTVDPEVDYP